MDLWYNTAPYVMLLMRASTLRGHVGGGEPFLGPVKWHRAVRRVPRGAQKSLDLQGPTQKAAQKSAMPRAVNLNYKTCQKSTGNCNVHKNATVYKNCCGAHYYGILTQLTSGVRSPTQMLVSTSPGARRVLLWFSLNLGTEKVGMKIHQCCRPQFDSRTCSDRILRILTYLTIKDMDPYLTGSIPPPPTVTALRRIGLKLLTSFPMHSSRTNKTSIVSRLRWQVPSLQYSLTEWNNSETIQNKLLKTVKKLIG